MIESGKPGEKIFIWGILAIILVLTFMDNATGSAAPPDIPMVVSGNVSINGQPAPAGTVINAVVGEEIINSTTISQPGKYAIMVVYKQGTVELYVNNVKARSIAWTTPQMLDLSVTIAGSQAAATVSPAATATAATAQSSGGQGGGATSAATAVPSPKVTVRVTDSIKPEAKITPQETDAPMQENLKEPRTVRSPGFGGIAVVLIIGLISRSAAGRRK